MRLTSPIEPTRLEVRPVTADVEDAAEPCGGCGGRGQRPVTDGRWTDLELQRPCTVCGGTGEEPAASAALLITLQEAAQAAGLDAEALQQLCRERIGRVPVRLNEAQALRLLAAIEARR